MAKAEASSLSAMLSMPTERLPLLAILPVASKNPKKPLAATLWSMPAPMAKALARPLAWTLAVAVISTAALWLMLPLASPLVAVTSCQIPKTLAEALPEPETAEAKAFEVLVTLPVLVSVPVALPLLESIDWWKPLAKAEDSAEPLMLVALAATSTEMLPLLVTLPVASPTLKTSTC